MNGPPTPAAHPPRPGRTAPVAVSTVAERIGARVHEPDLDTRTPVVASARGVVTGATLWAQHVRAGDLFAALPGARTHGAGFVTAALAAGASAVLTDPSGARRREVVEAGVPVLIHEDPRSVLGTASSLVYGNPSEHLAVLGITGTSGKTTTSYLVHAGLEAAGRVTGLVGTVETRVAGQRLTSALTTPEAPDLQALFALMRESGAGHVCMEVSSHALALGRVAGTRFAVGAFTNLSQDHLDFHGDMENYFAAKANLFDGRSRTRIICTDDEWGRRLVTPDAVTVSTRDSEAAWSAREVTATPDGAQSFVAVGPSGVRLSISLRLPGTFNVANALLAAAVLHAVGVQERAIADGLSTVGVPGRMEPVSCGQEFTAVVDYSHKPAAVSSALDAVRTQIERTGREGRVLVVLGCGGDRDVAKRRLMGAAAARRADLLVVTDDNPRSEDPAAIRAAMSAGVSEVPEAMRAEVIEVGDRRAAIAAAVERALPGDVLVVAGKGHEHGQEIAGVVHPFSDKDELEAAIRARTRG